MKLKIVIFNIVLIGANAFLWLIIATDGSVSKDIIQIMAFSSYFYFTIIGLQFKFTTRFSPFNYSIFPASKNKILQFRVLFLLKRAEVLTFLGMTSLIFFNKAIALDEKILYFFVININLIFIILLCINIYDFLIKYNLESNFLLFGTVLLAFSIVPNISDYYSNINNFNPILLPLNVSLYLANHFSTITSLLLAIPISYFILYLNILISGSIRYYAR